MFSVYFDETKFVIGFVDWINLIHIRSCLIYIQGTEPTKVILTTRREREGSRRRKWVWYWLDSGICELVSVKLGVWYWLDSGICELASVKLGAWYWLDSGICELASVKLGVWYWLDSGICELVSVKLGVWNNRLNDLDLKRKHLCSFHAKFCVIWSISRVPDQNGVSLSYSMLEIHHSDQEPSICSVLLWCSYTEANTNLFHLICSQRRTSKLKWFKQITVDMCAYAFQTWYDDRQQWTLQVDSSFCYFYSHSVAELCEKQNWRMLI